MQKILEATKARKENSERARHDPSTRETDLFQRSREEWIAYGDINTKFYHASTLVRRKRNRIERLKNNEGEWTT